MDLDSIADCGCRQNPDVEIIANPQPTVICANSRSHEALLLRTIASVMTGEGGGENWNEDLISIADSAGKG